MFKKILVPLDGSDLAAKIIPQVETLAKATNAEVILLSVGSSNICTVPGAAAKDTETEPCPELPLANYLEQHTAKLKAAGVAASWFYTVGRHPAQVIVAYAEANGMDLIALASHGAGEVAWLLGSVAKRIIDHSKVAVLLLRVRETEPPTLKSEMYYSLQTP